MNDKIIIDDKNIKTKYIKKHIHKAIKEQVWLNIIGKKFEAKCPIIWCNNIITVFSHHVAHNIPESKGGEISIDNLIPICASCNLSMSDNYTIKEWNLFIKPKKLNCFETLIYYFYPKNL